MIRGDPLKLVKSIIDDENLYKRLMEGLRSIKTE